VGPAPRCRPDAPLPRLIKSELRVKDAAIHREGDVTAFGLDKHHRFIRLKGYNYAQVGAYVVTVCTRDRACLFGEIVNGRMGMNDAGRFVGQCGLDIPHYFPHVTSDACVVMPNHVHGIIVLVGATPRGCRSSEQPRGVAPTTRRYADGIRQADWPFPGAAVAAQRLRTHHPHRGSLAAHPAIHRRQPRALGAGLGKPKGRPPQTGGGMAHLTESVVQSRTGIAVRRRTGRFPSRQMDGRRSYAMERLRG
jgi:hypothetical protein